MEPGRVYDDAYEARDLTVEGWKGMTVLSSIPHATPNACLELGLTWQCAELVLDLIRDYQGAKMDALRAVAALSEEEWQRVWAQTMDEGRDV